MPIYEEEPVVRRRVVRQPAVEQRIVEEPIVEQPVVQQRVVRDDPDDGLTSYALIKYGFILVMTLVILYFIANYLIPLVR